MYFISKIYNLENNSILIWYEPLAYRKANVKYVPLHQDTKSGTVNIERQSVVYEETFYKTVILYDTEFFKFQKLHFIPNLSTT